MAIKKLMDSQKSFDEKEIERLQVDYKRQYEKTSTYDLQKMLASLSDSTFESGKSAKRAFWLGPFGAMQHIVSRTREAQKRAIHEILKERASASLEDSITILKLRFAKGEITEEQYDDMLKKIT